MAILFNPAVRAALLDRSEAAGGFFHVATAYGCGVTPDDLVRMAARGEIERIRRSWYRFRGAPLGDLAALRAAVEACGPLAAACGATAARLRGIDRVPAPKLPEVMVPYRTCRVAEGVRVRRSRGFDPDAHVVEVHGIRCVTGPFNMVELADGRWTDDFLTCVLDDMVCKRRAGRSKVHDLASAMRPGRHHQVGWLARLTAPAARADFHSFLEAVAGRAFDARRLPPAEWNVPVSDDDGLIGIVDALWGWRPHVSEIEGLRFHSTPAQRRGDGERFNRLVLAGYRPLRHSYADLMTRPAWCADQVARALGL